MTEIVRSIPDRHTLVIAVLLVTAVVLGLATIQFTSSTPNGIGILLFVGMILPTIYREKGLK